MNAMRTKKLYGLMMALLGLCLLCGGCVRDDIPPCPPMQVVIEVTDKNYFNIDEVERQGLATRVDENLPFREYVSTLFYALYNAETGELVEKQSTFQVEGEEKEYSLTFPDALPYGRYALVVWGNLQSDEPLGEDPTTSELEEYDAWQNDIYVVSDTLDYIYGNESFRVGLERAKGKLIVQAVDLPNYVDFSTKLIDNVYSYVSHNFSYDKVTEVYTETHWKQPNDIVTETLLCPSTDLDESKLSVSFYDYSTVESQRSRAARLLTPEDVQITMGRNELTVVKYIYVREGDPDDPDEPDNPDDPDEPDDPDDGDDDEPGGDTPGGDEPDDGKFFIYVLVNDNWESQHKMEIE